MKKTTLAIKALLQLRKSLKTIPLSLFTVIFFHFVVSAKEIKNTKAVAVSNTKINLTTQGTPFARFQADLQFFSAEEGIYNNLSGANAYFNGIFSNAVILGEDNISPADEESGQIRILKGGYQLSTNRQPIITAQDTIFLFLSRSMHAQHRLVLSTKYFVPSSEAYLIDKYLNISTPFSITNSDSLFYNFTITDDYQSNRSDRFMVVFKPLNTTKVCINNFKVTKQLAGIALQWRGENELNTKSYEIERSTDGVYFNKITIVAAINSAFSSVYSWLDKTVTSENIFYRIRVTEKSGAITYSEVAMIKNGNRENSITILTNPIINNTIHLQFNNQQQGTYLINLYDQAGKLLDKKQTLSNGNTWGESFLPKYNLSTGTYLLEIIKPSGKKIIQKIIYP